MRVLNKADKALKKREIKMKQVKIPQPTLLTSTEEVLLKRRSVRLYRKDQVPKEMILRILEAGRYAPSAGNGQPWNSLFYKIRKL